jgi:hypothetical protein
MEQETITEKQPEVVPPVADATPQTEAKRAVFFTINRSDLLRSSYFHGYHDAISDVMLIAIIYGLVLYFTMKYLIEK